MAKEISLGAQNFEYIRKNQCFYIDKTSFIKEWWGSKDVVTLITRPRRFGKTLNMSMVERFFSIQYKDRPDLFEGLDIWKDEEYRTLQGTWPVISLSFADTKSKDFPTARKNICQILTRQYSRYGFLRDCGLLDEKEKEYFDRVSEKMDDADASSSLNYLADFLSRYYGKKPIILLDEYDTPLQESYIRGYWDEMVTFMRGLFHSTFKTNDYMERAILTGITRISKESIFSDLNNLAVITTTSERYAASFGFTEREVFQALEQYRLSEWKDSIREWYDGFNFGSQKGIYNPWSITSFLYEKKLKTYWANTSENSLVSSILQQGSPQIKMEMEDLLKGDEITAEIDEEIIFSHLNRKKGAIWSLLLASGYLKVVSEVFNGNRYIYQLKLTNKEVRIMFEDMILEWFADEEISYNNFTHALLRGDVDYMNAYMNQIAEVTFSTFDTGKKESEKGRPERFYHGFVLGLIIELTGEYRVTSNRESGFGRYDIMLEPLKAQKTAFVLEFKVKKASEKNLQETLQNALAQINEKDYDAELMARGIPKKQIRHYGFAFEGKTVLIG